MSPSDRVLRLTYAVVTDAPGIDLSEATAITYVIGNFECAFADEQLVATPRVDFDDETIARAELEAHLVAWEAAAAIDGRAAIRFEFAGAEIKRTDAGVKRVSGTLSLGLSLTASATLVIGELPAPPGPFVETPAVALLRRRIEDLRTGKDRLLAVGYYAYTVMCREYHSGKQGAARALDVDVTVFDTLNVLTSDRSHPVHERKSLQGKAPLTAAEEQWVRAALAGLVLRMAQTAAKAQGLRTLTVSDFGPLA